MESINKAYEAIDQLEDAVADITSYDTHIKLVAKTLLQTKVDVTQTLMPILLQYVLNLASVDLELTGHTQPLPPSSNHISGSQTFCVTCHFSNLAIGNQHLNC